MSDNEFEQDIKAVEEVDNPGGIALELLKELKEQNDRMNKITKGLIIAIVLVVGGFLLFMYQYDYGSYSQDGDGYNNINTGTQGDVNNGAEAKTTEAQGR